MTYLRPIIKSAPPNWSIITPEDECLYKQCFLSCNESVSYENNWAYICQEARYGGIKYVGKGFLLTGIIRHESSPFIFVFASIGRVEAYLAEIIEIAQSLARSLGRRVVLRKVPYSIASILNTMPNCEILTVEEYQLDRDIPEDVYPQAIIDVENTLRCGSGQFTKVRNHIAHFLRNMPTARSLTPESAPAVSRLIHEWNNIYSLRSPEGAERPAIDLSAYLIFAQMFAGQIDGKDYFGRLVDVKGVPVSLAFAGRTSQSSAALYCSISLTRYRGSSEYLVIDLLKELSKASVEVLNLGGSETYGLYQFKSKFRPITLRTCYDVECT